jgi:uncharacterized membrane protein
MQYEFFALITAVAFGFSHVSVRKAMRSCTPVTATLAVSAVQVTILSVILAFNPPVINFTAILYFVISGFLATILARTMNYLSINRLGVSISSSLTGTNPIFTMIISVLFIGEEATLITISGAFLVVLGVILISGWGSTGKLEITNLLIPLGSAFFYGLSSVVRKIGLNILPESVLGALVGGLTGLVLYPIILMISGRLNEVSLSKKAAPYLFGGGFAVSIAWVFMFLATQHGNVGVVSAIIGSNPLFGMILSILLLKETDKITPRVIIGSILIVVAVALITLF